MSYSKFTPQKTSAMSARKQHSSLKQGNTVQNNITTNSNLDSKMSKQVSNVKPVGNAMTHSMRKIFSFGATGLFVAAMLSAAGCSSSNTNDDAIVVGDTVASDRVTNPQQARITDPVIDRDLGTIGAYRSRLQRLNESGAEVSRYQLRKATRWTDFAYDEYTDNDRSAVVNAALAEADKIITGLERNPSGQGMSTETPIIETSMLVRDDLWRKIQGYKREQYYSCVEHHVADAEVYLVWAGHEYNEMGWRHAVPQVHMAERAIRAAEEGLRDANTNKGCFKTVIVEQAQVVAPPPPSLTKMPRYVHFAYKMHDVDGASVAVLDELVNVLRSKPSLRLRVEGHTDPVGGRAYNERLAKRRINSVVAYLKSKGVAANRLQPYVAGELEPLKITCNPVAYASNRRVTFVPLADDSNLTIYDPVRDLKIKRNQKMDCK